MRGLIVLLVAVLSLAATGAGAASFTFGPEAFRISGDLSARAGLFLKAGEIHDDWRFRTDLKFKGRLENGLKFGGSTRLDWVERGPYRFSSLGLWISHGKTKLSFNNTSGAVATLAGIWGCAAGYRGASCADLVTNLQPGGWSPTMTTSSSTGNGPGLVRFNTQLGDVKLAISGGGGNDMEVVAKFKVKKLGVAVGIDNGPGTTGGLTVITDYKRGDYTLGVDLGRYGTVSNIVVSLQKKTGKNTLYGYVSSLNGIRSVGVSYRRAISKKVTFGMGLENVGGAILADIGFKFRF